MAMLKRMVLLVVWRRSNFWIPFFNPPASIDNPRTKRRFPIMDPVMEAFTNSNRPLLIANRVMINSAAFPSVALINPPIFGPVWDARPSVPSPMRPASGITLIADRLNSRIAFHSCRDPMIAKGKAINNRVSGFFLKYKDKDFILIDYIE